MYLNQRPKGCRTENAFSGYVLDTAQVATDNFLNENLIMVPYNGIIGAIKGILGMKIILSSKIHHYLARVSIFLMTVALVVGMTGCFTPFPTQYELTISSPAGEGVVTKPGEGTFTYSAGTVVDLVAMPEEGYSFVEWTGDVHSIGNADAAVTYIIMNDNYDIEAGYYCEYCPFEGYCLNTSSTDCGEVCEPGEGPFIYVASTVVDLVAEPFEGCVFEYWSGDVETIADINVATTNITMYDNYSIKAVFSFNITPVAAGG